MSWKRGSDHRNETDEENFDEEELLGDDEFSGDEEGYVGEEDNHSSLLDEEDDTTSLTFSQQQFHSQVHADSGEHHDDRVHVGDEELLGDGEEGDAEIVNSGDGADDNAGMLDTQVSEDEYAEFPEPANDGEAQPRHLGPKDSAVQQQGNARQTIFQTRQYNGRRPTRTWRPNTNNPPRFTVRHCSSSHVSNAPWPRFQPVMHNTPGWMPANTPFRPPLPLMNIGFGSPRRANSNLPFPQPVAGNGLPPSHIALRPSLRPPLIQQLPFPANQNITNTGQSQPPPPRLAFRQVNRARFNRPHPRSQSASLIAQRPRPRRDDHWPQRHVRPRGRINDGLRAQWHQRKPQPELQAHAGSSEPTSSKMEIEYNHGLNQPKKPGSLDGGDNSPKKKALLPSPDMQYEEQLARQAEQRDRIRREKEKRRRALAMSAAKQADAAVKSPPPQLQGNKQPPIATALVKPQRSQEKLEQLQQRVDRRQFAGNSQHPSPKPVSPGATQSVSCTSQVSADQASLPSRFSNHKVLIGHDMHQAPSMNVHQRPMDGHNMVTSPPASVQSATIPQQRVGQLHSQFSQGQLVSGGGAQMQQQDSLAPQVPWYPNGPRDQNFQHAQHHDAGQSNIHGRVVLAPAAQHMTPVDQGMAPAAQYHIVPANQHGIPVNHMASANHQVTPAGLLVTPADQHMTPANEHMTPANQHMTPANQHMTPADGVYVSDLSQRGPVPSKDMQYAQQTLQVDSQGQQSHRNVLYAQPSATLHLPQNTLQNSADHQQQLATSQPPRADALHASHTQAYIQQGSQQMRVSHHVTSPVRRKRAAWPQQAVPAKSAKPQYRVHPLDMFASEAEAASMKALTQEGDEEYDQDGSQMSDNKMTHNSKSVTTHINPRHLKKVKELVVPASSTKQINSTAKCSSLSERFRRHHVEKKTDSARRGASAKTVRQNSLAAEPNSAGPDDELSQFVSRQDNSMQNIAHQADARPVSKRLGPSRQASLGQVNVPQRSPAVQRTPSKQIAKESDGAAVFRHTIRQAFPSASSSSSSSSSHSGPAAAMKVKPIDRRCCKVLGFDRASPIAVIREMGNEVGEVDRVGRLKKNPEIVVITFMEESQAVAFRRQFNQSQVMGKRIKVEFVKGSQQR